MNIDIQNISDTRKKLVVTLDASEVDAEHKAVVAEFSRLARIPGFRPGKAPAAMVVKRFAKDIEGEFKQKVTAKAYREGLEQSKLDVINLVDLDDGAIAPGAAATLAFTMDLRPVFELPEYAGLPTVVESVDVTDAEIDRVVENLRGERADFKVAERPAAKGDYVKLAYTGTIDGKPILEIAPDKQIYGQVPQTWEEVEGENDGLIPGLGRHLAGLKAGDKKDVPVTFPAEFTAVPALAGKAAVYAVEVQEVRERVLPELNEEFFKAHQADNLEGLRASISSQLKFQKEGQNRSAQRRQVTEALLAKVDFPVPESLVEAETQGVLRQFIEENMRRGVQAEQFEKDKKELYEGAKKAAHGRVKSQLLLAKIAEKEKLEVTERDIDAFIYREAMRTQQSPDKLVKDLSKNREQLRSIQQSIIFDKALDLLVSKATVTSEPAKA